MKGKRVSPARTVNKRASRSPGNFAREFGIWGCSFAREASHSTPQTVITRARRREVTCFLQRILIRNVELGLLNLPVPYIRRGGYGEELGSETRETETFAATRILLAVRSQLDEICLVIFFFFFLFINTTPRH